MAQTGGDFVRFPPRWRNILVPSSPARATALGTTLYTASRPLPCAAQSVLWALARLGGGRALPGPHESWEFPLEPDVLAQLQRDWVSVVGRTPDGVAVYERKHASRAVLTFLLCAGRNSVLVRLRRDAESLTQERRISETAQALAPRTFAVPELAGQGEREGWHWSAFHVMSLRPHRPRYRLPAGAADEIAALVERVVPRPDDTPSDWIGAHLDVSPWNLRRTGRRTWLIDWEDAGYAPPGADEVYLDAIVSAMRTSRTTSLASVARFPEAARYWAPIIAARQPNPAEVHLRDRMLDLLDASDQR